MSMNHKTRTFSNDTDLHIRRVRISEAVDISALVMRSKAYWPYPKDYLSQCVHALKIDEAYIADWPVFSGEVGGVRAGVFALKEFDNERRLDHLWVDPPFIGKGIGKRLFMRAIIEARQIGWNDFRLAADPFAVEFYLKLGGRQIGAIQSRIKPDLVLPHIEFSF